MLNDQDILSDYHSLFNDSMNNDTYNSILLSGNPEYKNNNAFNKVHKLETTYIIKETVMKK